MPIPVVSYVAATLGAGVLSRILTPTLDQAFLVEPTKRISTYQQNFEWPNALPGIDACLHLYHAGYFNDPNGQQAKDILKSILAPQGIACFNTDTQKAEAKVWTRFITHARSKPGIGDVLTLLHQDKIDDKEALDRLLELGYSNKRERELLVGVETPLSFEMVINFYHRDILGRQESMKKLKALGFMNEDIQKKLLDLKPVWTLPDVRTLNLRGDIQDIEVPEYLRRAGYYTREDVYLFNRLKPFVPPPSDLVRFAVRDIFDPNLPDREGMLREYAEQGKLKEWFRIQGIGPYSFETSTGLVETQDVGELYWLASFELPSPTQAYTMFQRLRPNRVDRYQVGEVNGNPVFPAPVTLTDIRALLKDKDYRPGWRDRLTAISYLPVQKRDVEKLYADGVYGQPMGREGWQRQQNGSYRPTRPAEQELYEVMQDRGYSPYDAGQLGYLQSTAWEKAKGGVAKAKTHKLLCKAYQLGSISKTTLVNRLLATGLKQLDAQTIADNCDLEYAVRTLEKGIAAIRAAVLSGRIDATEARRLLNGQDVNLDRVNQLLRQWQIEIVGRSKEATAKQMCDWVGSGLITTQEMAIRLKRLHWRDDDIVRIVRHCIIGHNANLAKDREKRARAEAKERDRIEREINRLRQSREKEVARLERREEQAAKEALRRMREGRDPLKIKRYFKRGLVSVQEVRQTLLDRGWSLIDTDRWINTELTSG